MSATDANTAADRRIWRLAFLLTGNGAGATTLIDQIHRVQRNPLSLEPALFDRMIIQNARSIPRSGSPVVPAGNVPAATLAGAESALTALLSLNQQPREAWILRRIDDVDELHAARAMDCSKTAARTHLSSAEESMAARLGERLLPAIAALRLYADSLDPAPLVSQHRADAALKKRQRLKRNAIIAGIASMLALFALLKILSELKTG